MLLSQLLHRSIAIWITVAMVNISDPFQEFFMSDITFLPISSNIVSTDTGVPVRFTLTNTSKEAVTLYWIDRSGVEQSYLGLKPYYLSAR